MPRKRASLGWCYRPNRRALAAPHTAVDVLGTYDSAFITVAEETPTGHILYDSQNFLSTLAGSAGAGFAATVFGVLPKAARAEGKGALIRGVDIVVYQEPVGWALGNVQANYWRLGIFDQEPASGTILIDVNYNMGTTPIIWAELAAHWANQVRSNLKEWRMWNAFSDGGMPPLQVFRGRWRGRRRLEPNECLALYHEVPPTANDSRCQLWCRTLVEDES